MSSESMGADHNNSAGSSPTSASAAPAPAPIGATTDSSTMSKPRKRAKVSFSREVIAKDDSGDGSGVVIREEHGVFLGPLLGRITMSSSDASSSSDAGDYDCDGNTDEPSSAGVEEAPSSTSEGPMISFDGREGEGEKVVSFGELSSPTGILKTTWGGGSGDDARAQQRWQLGDMNVEYDNLAVHMGLLKCGHRYRVAVPIPDYWNRKDVLANNKLLTDGDDEQQEGGGTMQSHHEQPCGMDVRVVEDSLDGDLRGEVQSGERADADAKESDPSSSATTTSSCQYRASITLSARRRGQYRGRFVLELTRRRGRRAEMQSPIEAAEPPPPQRNDSTTGGCESDAKNTTTDQSSRCLMSLQVDATIMGKDMGTPKLRNGVVCLGKMVGYDSDDETEWQGFD